MKKIDGEMAYIGLDLVFPVSFVHCEDAQGRVLIQRDLARDAVVPWLSKLPRCIVGLEAATAVDGVAARLTNCGHSVILIAPRDLVDGPDLTGPSSSRAEALCHALRRNQVQPLPMRTLEERRRSAANRVRALLSRQRMALFRAARIVLDDFGCDPCIGARDLDRLQRQLDALASTGEAGQAADSLSALLTVLQEHIARLGDADRGQPRPTASACTQALSG